MPYLGIGSEQFKSFFGGITWCVRCHVCDWMDWMEE